jgi:hypothetical protein
MKDAYQVLHEKEADLARVRKQVESLHIVAALLAESSDQDEFDEADEDDRASDSSDKKPSTSAASAASGEPSPVSKLSPFLDALRRAK